jgi:hypothetical protein
MKTKQTQKQIVLAKLLNDNLVTQKKLPKIQLRTRIAGIKIIKTSSTKGMVYELDLMKTKQSSINKVIGK